MKYAFGDSDIAARRLKALHEVFSESTGPFLEEAAAEKPRLAMDLGCGPGHTTHFLADVLACGRTVGLGNSEHFISLAQATSTGSVSFRLHDVACVPFPEAPADLVYGRFLLTHIQQPEVAVAKWASQLNPGGRLLLEETEWIHTDNVFFRTYIEIVDAMLASQSNILYIGPLMERFANTEIMEKHASRVRRLSVSNARTAAMFALNVQTWKHHPFVKANYPAKSVEDLQENLRLLAAESGGKTQIVWGLRQMVFRRR